MSTSRPRQLLHVRDKVLKNGVAQGFNWPKRGNLVSPALREKIHYIRTEGTQGVEKLSCDADLVMLLRYERWVLSGSLAVGPALAKTTLWVRGLAYWCSLDPTQLPEGI